MEEKIETIPLSLSQMLAVPSTPDATWRDDWQQWWPVIECGRDNKRGILIATSIRFPRNMSSWKQPEVKDFDI